MAGMLFHRVRTDGALEPVTMKHFPFRCYKYMMWCDRLVTRMKSLAMTEEDARHEGSHLLQAMFNYEKWYQYYLRYVWEWTKVLFRSGFSLRTAYKCNPFEMEAVGNESPTACGIGRNTWKRYRIKHPRSAYRRNRRRWKLFCQEIAKEVQP